LHGWSANVSVEDQAMVEQVLGPAGPQAAALFRRMPRDAQAHSLRVLKALQANVQQADVQQTGVLSPRPLPPDLAAAALLHDVGKAAAGEAGAYLGLWLRGPLVLLERWCPDLLVQWASPQPAPSIRYALYVHHAHPEVGANMARAAGCTPLTCWLIAHHQDPQAENGAAPGDDVRTATAYQYLARLQWADGRN
jgi:hypothetical protein